MKEIPGRVPDTRPGLIKTL